MKRTSEQWRQLIDAQAQSTLTIKQYCQEQGISQSAFYRNKSPLCEPSTLASPFSQVELAIPALKSPNEDCLALTFGQSCLTIPINSPPNWVASLLKALA